MSGTEGRSQTGLDGSDETRSLSTAVKAHSASFSQNKTSAASLSVVLFVAAWQVLSYLYPIGIPTPLATAEYLHDLLVNDFDLFFNEFTASLFRIVIGFGVALFLSTLVGVLMGYREEAENHLFVLVIITMMIPSLSWAMMSLIVFGLNETAIILAVVFTTTPFMIVTIWEGVKDADKGLIEMGRVFGFTNRDLLRHVIMPQITPYVFSSARYGLALAWKITVVVELLGSSSGLGYQLSRGFQLFSIDAVFGWTLIIILSMIFIEYVLIRPFEHWVLDWREKGVVQ